MTKQSSATVTAETMQTTAQVSTTLAWLAIALLGLLVLGVGVGVLLFMVDFPPIITYSTRHHTSRSEQQTEFTYSEDDDAEAQADTDHATQRLLSLTPSVSGSSFRQDTSNNNAIQEWRPLSRSLESIRRFMRAIAVQAAVLLHAEVRNAEDGLLLVITPEERMRNTE